MRAATKKRIRELGYRSYSFYLRSPHWLEFRRRYWLTHERKCSLCDRTFSITLHHISYANLGNETEADVIPLCKGHHRGLHTFMKNYRCKLELAHIKYAEHLLKPKKKPRPRKRKAKRKPL